MTALEAERELKEINPRRGALIKKRYSVGLSWKEARELRTLQQRVRRLVDIIAPLPPLPKDIERKGAK